MLAELQQVSKHYGQTGSGTENTILNRISLAIGEKETVAITGPSGSGKSTLLNILGTLDQPSSGRVLLDGMETGTQDAQQLAGTRNRFLGFVFQLHHLLPQLTLLENVLLPALPMKEKLLKKAAEDRARQLIERMGLTGLIHRHPMQLSVGECQRAAVARALVNSPRLLLADEPTGSLDAHSAALLGQLLVEFNQEQGLAIVVVTHSVELASRMGKIYRLTSGELHLMHKP
jgi:ABC-type lipoprotein export system ATPase subunit